MSPDFSAINARARGLTAHLFTRPDLEALAGHDANDVARAAKLRAYVNGGASALELERAARLMARHHLRTLARWGGAAPVLGVFWADQDRRSLRALLRGALATASAEERLAGLIPTPTLPERVLIELARQPTPAAIASHLFALGHPDAARLAPLTAATQPDLLALELAVTQGSAERATREAARGDANLEAFVARRLDVANVQAALLLATETELEPERCFLAGGRELSLAGFLAVAGDRSVGGSARRLRALLATTLLAPLVAEAALDPARVDRRALVLALEDQRRASRLSPLSSAPVLLFLLRLEAQGRDLRHLLWGAALGAPGALLRSDLVMS